MNWFDWVRSILIVAGGLGAVIFPVYYHVTAPGWRHSEMGRFLMVGGMGLASLYLAGIIAVLFPSEIVRDILRLVFILGAGSFAWYQVFLYRKVRRDALQRKRERRE